MYDPRMMRQMGMNPHQMPPQMSLANDFMRPPPMGPGMQYQPLPPPSGGLTATSGGAPVTSDPRSMIGGGPMMPTNPPVRDPMMGGGPMIQPAPQMTAPSVAGGLERSPAMPQTQQGTIQAQYQPPDQLERSPMRPQQPDRLERSPVMPQTQQGQATMQQGAPRPGSMQSPMGGGMQQGPGQNAFYMNLLQGLMGGDPMGNAMRNPFMNQFAQQTGQFSPYGMQGGPFPGVGPQNAMMGPRPMMGGGPMMQQGPMQLPPMSQFGGGFGGMPGMRGVQPPQMPQTPTPNPWENRAG